MESFATVCKLLLQSSSLASSFIKKRLQNRCFPANIAKKILNIYFEEHLRTAASEMKTEAYGFRRVQSIPRKALIESEATIRGVL